MAGRRLHCRSSWGSGWSSEGLCLWNGIVWVRLGGRTSSGADASRSESNDVYDYYFIVAVIIIINDIKFNQHDRSLNASTQFGRPTLSALTCEPRLSLVSTSQCHASTGWFVLLAPECEPDWISPGVEHFLKSQWEFTFRKWSIIWCITISQPNNYLTLVNNAIVWEFNSFVILILTKYG